MNVSAVPWNTELAFLLWKIAPKECFWHIFLNIPGSARQPEKSELCRLWTFNVSPEFHWNQENSYYEQNPLQELEAAGLSFVVFTQQKGIKLLLISTCRSLITISCWASDLKLCFGTMDGFCWDVPEDGTRYPCPQQGCGVKESFEVPSNPNQIYETGRKEGVLI